MIIDGNALAQDIIRTLRAEVAKKDSQPSLALIVVGNDPVTERFVRLKTKRAAEAGIAVTCIRFPDSITENELISGIRAVTNGSIVVQLPLPEKIDRKRVLGSIPVTQDVDVLSEASIKAFREGTIGILPPVVGAITEIARHYDVSFKDKRVTVLGEGKLVGRPAIHWLKRSGVQPVTVDIDTPEPVSRISAADIIISGIGVPGFIKPYMVREGAVLFDAGTSEKDGTLSGDADPACAQKCALFTPVPGGIGPLTVACLLRNVVEYTHDA